MIRTVCIDDSDAARYIFSHALRQAGHEVSEASTAEEGLRLVREVRPDLVLLDVHLPDGNGRQVCAEIRLDPDIASTPVLMVSATAIEHSDRMSGLTGGADGYLIEPVDPQELVALVNSLLRMSRAERAVRALNEQLQARVTELETIFDTVPVGIAMTRDPECRSVRANPLLTAMMGGDAHSDISHSATADAPRAYTVLRDGEVVRDENLPLQYSARTGQNTSAVELEIVRADGSRVSVLSHATPIRDGANRVTGAVGAWVDITEGKREQARQRMLADAALLLADALDLSTTLDQVARIAVRHLADWCVVDLAAEKDRLERSTVIHRDAARAARAIELRDRSRPDATHVPPLPRDLDLRSSRVVRPADDEVRDTQVGDIIEDLGMPSSINAPLLARGKCLGVLSLVSATIDYDERDRDAASDLAHRAALAIDNALLYRAAQEANHAKDQFLTTVSHELRTPLTSIAGWIGMLRRDPSDPSLVEQSAVELEKASTTLRRLVDELLDIARVSSGKLLVEKQPIDLAAIVQGVCEAARPVAAAKSIRLEVAGEPRAIVLGDPLRLQQVATNLVSNAIKFTPSGGRIDVDLQYENGSYVFRVSDTGVGVQADFLPRIFDRFSQAQPAWETGGGLGIGLALVKELVELHGGYVFAESDGPGRGTTLTVTIPRFSGETASALSLQ